MSDTPGIHHVTAIVGDPQPNVDFYTGVLGLRFLKRTVNHEDRFAYHLYYGDGAGSTGSVITFFPHPGDDGRVGKSQTSAVAFDLLDTESAFGREGPGRSTTSRCGSEARRSCSSGTTSFGSAATTVRG